MRYKVSFCVGDANKKRAHFLAAGARCDALQLDNDEVISVYERNGRTYFIEGDIPYASMTVGEYIVYSRSKPDATHLTEKGIKYYNRLFKARLPLRRKMKSLSVLSYRTAQLIAGYDPTVTRLYINLDGLLYTHKNGRRLKKMLTHLSRLFHIYVAVSDCRFSKNSEQIVYFNTDGAVTTVKLRGWRAKRIKKNGFLALYAKQELGVERLPIRRVVEIRDHKAL